MGFIEDLIQSGMQSQLNPEVLAKQRRTQGAISGVAGIADAIGGGIGQRQAEGDIDRFGAEADSIRQQMKDIKAPSIMSPENQAAAVRNATILGAGKPQEDSSELAAAKMAMDAGADPANIQRALTEAEAQKDARARAEQQGAFKEGLGYAHQDAMGGYQKEMQDLGMDYDENQRALEMAQHQSLAAQQQKQGGFGNLAAGATKFLSSGGVDAIGNLFGRPKKMDPANALQASQIETPFSGGNAGGSMTGSQNSNVGSGITVAPRTMSPTVINSLFGVNPSQIGGGLDGDPNTIFAQGGVVQSTPGAFNHDNGDGEFQTGENEILGFARTENGLEDTGVRMTGGEFVINPKQAKGMEKAYDRVKKKKNPSRADLMALYEAVRFIDEPQFD